MKNYLIILLFIVSWKTKLPNGSFFWSTTEGFNTFYDATEFIEKLLVNPSIKEIKLKKEN